MFLTSTVKAGSQPVRVKLNTSKQTLLPGEKTVLQATVMLTGEKGTKLIWKSSNPSVVSVSSRGRISARKAGTAVITAAASNGKKASCKILVKPLYVDSRRYVRIRTSSGNRTYYKYCQNEYGPYIASYGCITTAVATIASSYGYNYTPWKIHTASASHRYSEKYALRKLTGNSGNGLYDRAAITVALAAQILNDMRIPAKPVYQFTVRKAVADMKANLAKGNPVLVKASNKRVKGFQIANGHHALVLIGIDKKNHGIFIDPYSGKLNYAHASRNYFTMNLETFVKNHMIPCSGTGYTNPFVTGISENNYSAGGYVLVGK